MRVSELITTDEVKTWEIGDSVMIIAPTGRGKSYFIINRLKFVADTKGRKILLLTNRNLLKDQFITKLIQSDKSGTIKIVNYQKIEEMILYGESVEEFNKYDYIICDEAHYFFADSTFNNTTDLSLEWVLNQTNKIRVFMSATADFFYKYIAENKKIETLLPYIIENDYNYIKNLYFYKDEDVLKRMLYEIPKNEKAIYFGGAAKAYNIATELNSIADIATFYCSENNRSGYAKYRDLDTYEQIKNNSKFDKKILCTTIVMDCGINIKDESVKHIIVDVFDPDTIEQCIGRKRMQNKNDKINVYIKNYNGQSVSGKRLGTLNKIQYAELLKSEGQDKLIEEYPRRNYGNLIYSMQNEDGTFNYKVNDIAYAKQKDIILFCEKLLENEKGEGFMEYISERFKFSNIQMLEDVYNAMDLNFTLESRVGSKLYQDQQTQLVDLINLRDSRNRQQKSYKQIKAYIEDNTNFTIVKGRDKRRILKDGNENPNRDEYFWEIIKTEIA